MQTFVAFATNVPLWPRIEPTAAEQVGIFSFCCNFRKMKEALDTNSIIALAENMAWSNCIVSWSSKRPLIRLLDWQRQLSFCLNFICFLFDNFQKQFICYRQFCCCCFLHLSFYVVLRRIIVISAQLQSYFSCYFFMFYE